MSGKEDKKPDAPGGGAPGVEVTQDSLKLDVARLTTEASADLPAGPATPSLPPAINPIEKETGEDLTQIFGLLGMVVWPNWKLGDAENKALGEGTAKVLLKYYPEGLGSMGPEMGLGLTALAVFGPRVVAGIPMTEPKPKTEAEPVNGKNEEARANG